MATCLQIGVLSTCEPLGPVDRLVRSGAGGGLRSWADAVTTHGVGGGRHAGRLGGCPAGGRCSSSVRRSVGRAVAVVHPAGNSGSVGRALLLRGAGPAAAAAVAGAALTAAVGPRAVPYRQPPAAGPVLRVLTANLLADRAVAEAVAELACRTHADVLFVQELTGDAAAGLQRAGLGDLLPVPGDAAGAARARQHLRPLPAARRPARCAALCSSVHRPACPSVWAVRAAGLHPRGAAEASLVPGRRGPVAQSAVRAARARWQPAHPRR
jgi:hypothetical protein